LIDDAVVAGATPSELAALRTLGEEATGPPDDDPAAPALTPDGRLSPVSLELLEKISDRILKLVIERLSEGGSNEHKIQTPAGS